MDIETQLEKAAKLLSQGRIWESQKIYDDIIDFDSDCEPAIINKAIIFFRDKKYMEPVNLLSKLKKGERQVDVKLIEASCFYEINDLEQSQSCYNVLSTLVNENNDLIFRVGLSSMQHGFYLSTVKILGKI